MSGAVIFTADKNSNSQCNIAVGVTCDVAFFFVLSVGESQHRIWLYA